MKEELHQIMTNVPTADVVSMTLLRLIERMDERMGRIENTIDEVKESVLRLELTGVESRVTKLEVTAEILNNDFHKRQGSNNTLTWIAEKMPWLLPLAAGIGTYIGVKNVN